MASSTPAGPAPITGPAVPAPTGRVLRPRTKVVSHKNTCGAIAPSTTLNLQEKPARKSKSRKNALSSSNETSRTNFLKLITQGNRLEAGAVRYINNALNLRLYQSDSASSGVVAVAMAESRSFVQYVKSVLFATCVWTSVASRTTWNLYARRASFITRKNLAHTCVLISNFISEYLSIN
jgi:hypothetical protein